MTEHDPNPRAVMGGNNPLPYNPDEIAAFQAQVKTWADAVGDWLDKKEIASEEEAAKVTDFITGARKIASQIEKARETAKAPILESGRTLDAAYQKPASIIEASIKKMKALQTKWLQAVRDAEEKRRAADALAAKQAADAAAAALAAAAARNDIAGEVEAQEAQEAAEKALAAAAAPVKTQAKSASGGGRTMSLRSRPRVVITNIRQAFLTVQSDPSVVEAVQKSLNARVRAATWDGVVPAGCDVLFEEVAV